MISKRSTLVFIILAITILFAGAITTQAATSTLTWNISCTGFSSNGGSIHLDRDNTGRGVEQFVLTAIDGEGNVIFDPIVDSGPVGETVFIDSSVSYLWTTRPVSNPLVLTMTSPAGFGHAEQVLFILSVNCPTLRDPAPPPPPTATPLPPPDPSTTSPSVGVNEVPPTGANTAEQFIGEAGSLYVDRVTANIRSGDGLQYTVVGRVEGGTRLLVRGTNRARDWWFVEVGTLRGWISNTVVIISGDLRGVPVIEVRGEIIKPTLYVYRNQFIRQSPRERSIALCLISGGREYVIAGRNRNSSWFAIEAECSGQEVIGWILAEHGAVRTSGGVGIPVLP